jgi:alpha-L-fucosidase
MIRQNLITLTLLLLTASLFSSCEVRPPVQRPESSAPYDLEDLKSQPIPAWFDDAKFGIFIHWGVYSVLGYHKGNRGYAEWAPTRMYEDPEHYYPILEERFGAHPPEFGYKDMVPLFTAKNWDPDAWAELFRDAGARYVVLTAEHHDGFAMWDSELTPWNAVDKGPKRDLVGDLGVAVRKLGLKYAPSYHRERHNGFFGMKRYAQTTEPRPDVAKEIEAMPEAASLYGPFSVDDAFIEDFVARWKEIETKYEPDFMWLDHIPIFHERWSEDHDHPAVHRFREAGLQLIAEYYRAGEKWGKAVYTNNKGPKAELSNWPEGVGCREADNMKLDTIGPKWQNPATLGTSFGYMEWEELNDAYKSPTELIHLLCDVVSKNGNLLLNIGPKPDGTIPEGMQTRLRAMGDWLKLNGEAIYGTRPWVKPKQFNPELRFTTKGDTLYAIAFEKPERPFVIELSGEKSELEIAEVTLIGSGEKPEWERVEQELQITPPAETPGEHAWVFRIQRK